MYRNPLLYVSTHIIFLLRNLALYIRRKSVATKLCLSLDATEDHTTNSTAVVERHNLSINLFNLAGKLLRPEPLDHL